MSAGSVHATVVGFCRVHGLGQYGGHRAYLGVHGAEEQLGGMAVETEVLLGDGKADEGHRVHLGDQQHGIQDADDGEPVPADPHLRRVGQVLDAEQAGRLGPEDDRREVGRRRVQKGAVRDGGPEGGRQGGVGGAERDAVGVDARHKSGAVHVGIGDGADLGHVRDRPDARHHAFGGGGQLGLLTEGGAGGLDGEEVAELPELVEQTGLRRLGDAEHADDRRDADADPEGGQHRSHPPAAQPEAPDAEQVPAGQPGAAGVTHRSAHHR